MRFILLQNLQFGISEYGKKHVSKNMNFVYLYA